MFSKEKKGRIVLGMMAGAVVFTASAATTGAYLKQTTEGLKNVLASGDVTVEVEEPGWREKSGDSILPGESRTKNPLVKNIGSLDAWVFLEVCIPIRKISLVNESTKRKQPEKETELFRFQTNSGWELIEKTRTGNDMCYVYGWKKTVALSQKTDALFDSITMVPYLEGSLDEKAVQQIRVTAKAVQKNIASAGTGLKELYQICLSSRE